MLNTREKSSDIRDKHEGRMLVGDGAVGTLLAELDNEDAPKLARNLILEAKPLVDGAYLMPPASMPHLAGDVIEPIV